jgi:hypothetical protein
MSEPSSQWGGRDFGRTHGEGAGPTLRGSHPARNVTHRATASLAFGTLALVAGIVLLLDRFGILDASSVFRFWPVVMIGLGLGLLFQKPGANVVPGMLLSFLGTLFLIRNIGYADVRIRDLWPVILILVGATILVNTLRARRTLATAPHPEAGSPNTDVLNDFAMFGGVVKIVQSQNFRGGELFAMFGGIEVNLRKARLAPNQPVILNATAVMGGIELRVPDDWYIVNEGIGILGGYSDSRRFIETEAGIPMDPSRTLIVRGIAVFGGVDIKN